jgi:8-oxo-dGTP pyrophosphatase MutT (NUDIX family)
LRGVNPVNRPTVDRRDVLPQAFFARAAARLHGEPPIGPATGEQELNPGLFAEGEDFRDAAVLVPLVEHEGGLTALLTLRTPYLAVHAGQVAFPGGKIEPSDEGPAAAALREAQEEVGLDPAAVSVLGYLDRYLTGTGYRITPVIGRVAPNPVLALNPSEVQEAFEVPLAFLMDPKNHNRGSRTFMGRERHFYEMPFEGRYIWGITAGIIRGLYERMFGP